MFPREIKTCKIATQFSFDCFYLSLFIFGKNACPCNAHPARPPPRACLLFIINIQPRTRHPHTHTQTYSTGDEILDNQFRTLGAVRPIASLDRRRNYYRRRSYYGEAALLRQVACPARGDPSCLEPSARPNRCQTGSPHSFAPDSSSGR